MARPRERAATVISLRPMVDDDASWLETWLGPVAASVRYDEIAGQNEGASLIARLRSERGLQVRVIERDGADVGVVVYRTMRKAATIEVIATPASEARRGAGMGAAVIIEDEVRAAGVRVLYAPAPAVHGIATYFWIRLGYRPLMRAEWPCERDGVAWLVREL